MSAAFEAWVQRARDVPIEHVIEHRGIMLKGNGTERCGPCPRCGGDDRFSINAKKQVFHCRQCDVGGDVIKLVEHVDGVAWITACTTLTGEPPPKNVKPNGKDRFGAEPKKVVVAEYPYHDESGALVLVVERIEYQNTDGTFVHTKEGKRKKSFRQKRPDPDRPGAWLWNVNGAPVLPYRLPDVIEAIAAGHPILIVEGEAKVELLRTWNVAATCCAGGAKKWRAEHAEYVRGADVVILPDNDPAGWEHIGQVGAALSGIATRVRVLALPGLRPKGDIIDWAGAGQAPDWQLPSETPTNTSRDKEKAAAEEQKLIDELARLTALDYDRRRDAAANQMGIRRATLDDAVEARRAKQADEAGQPPLFGHWIVEPWPKAVDTSALIISIIELIKRYVVFSEDGALTVALWVLFAWVHNAAAVHSPILLVTSAEANSGKTQLLSIINFLVPTRFAVR
jgi:CHC2 zinc finger